MQRLVIHLLATVVCASLVRAQTNTFTVAETVEFEVGTVAFAPKWSPNGQWIAFSMPKANGIGLVRPDGSGLRTLTTEPGSGYKFAWSPDATRIAFRREVREQGARHYIIGTATVADGKVESSTSIIKEAQPPVWQSSANGMRWVTHGPSGVVESAWRGAEKKSTASVTGPPLIEQRGTELWLYHADPARRWKLSGDFGLNPVWSADGSKIVYDACDKFVVVKPDAAAPPPPPVMGLNPAWSPDGAWLVYQITRDHWHAADDQRQHTPDTAPHAHNDKTNHRIVDSELWIIGADGRGRQRLTHTPDVLESDPDWSPDGRAVVCRTEETGKIRVLTFTKP